MSLSKPHLLVMKGLPGSGKSTWAADFMKSNPGYKRVNFDLLREMLDFGKWSKSNEAAMQKAAIELVLNLGSAGYNVILDNTGLSVGQQNAVNGLSAMFNIEVVDLTGVPLQTCLDRDEKRGDKAVGRKVIMDMWNKYIRKSLDPVPYDVDLPDCVICDIDGTIADHNGIRSPYDESSVYKDVPRCEVIEVVDSCIAGGSRPILVSGRSESCRYDTEAWLKRVACLPFFELFMRKTGDTRPDDIVKREIYEEHIKGRYNVVAVFDDRAKVCRMWDDVGLGDRLFRVGRIDADEF